MEQDKKRDIRLNQEVLKMDTLVSSDEEFRKIIDIISDEVTFINPNFVSFNFKKEGDHMEDEELGVIRRGANMFDMVFGSSFSRAQRRTR